MDGVKKLKRFSQVAQVISKYGLEELISRSNIETLTPSFFTKWNPKARRIFEQNIYVRLRLALEELGPTYIKLGQLISNRKDLASPEMIAELQKLQDNVPPENYDIEKKIEKEFHFPASEYFQSIEKEPIAAASISQVYKAKFHSGEEVILKVKRDNIDQIIDADLAILRDIALYLENNYDNLRKKNLMQILQSFENSIRKELSLTNEYQNIERFRHNFIGSPDVYVPLVYPQISNNNVLCMEFISGCKINDKEKIEALGYDPKKIVLKGLDIYVKQILDDGFFHADPHPGNIFFREDGKIVFIDFGSMGYITNIDKQRLEEIVINFGFKNPHKIIRNLKKLAITHYIEDENQLARDILDIIDYIDFNTIDTIDVQVIIRKMNQILSRNHILMPEFIYILMRGIALIEGVGQQLDANLNLQKAIRPYAKKIAKEKLHPKNIAEQTFQNFKNSKDLIEDIPEDFSKLINKIANDQMGLNFHIQDLPNIERLVKNSINKLVLAILTLTFGIGSSYLSSTEIWPMIGGIPLLAWIGFGLSIFTGLSIVVLIFRNK